MKPFPSWSLLLSTYNWPEALEVTVNSVFAQSKLPGEIIICDDGSAASTQEVIDRLRKVANVPVIHVWQPDEGFQLSRIRNKGLAAASGAYILQIDGDIILHKHFVRDHLIQATRGHFYSGNRFYLSPALSKEILDLRTTSVPVVPAFSKNVIRQLRIPALQKLFARYYHWEKEYQFILGCNMGFWREDIFRINGYDEAFEGWGSEDTEMAFRLINQGVKLNFIRFGAIQYHLHHKSANKENSERNYAIACKSRENKSTWCQLGVDQYVLKDETKYLTAANSKLPFFGD